MKHQISKRTIYFSIFMVIMFLVIGVHAEEENCIDVSGTWEAKDEVDASEFGGKRETNIFTYDLIQKGCDVTLKRKEPRFPKGDEVKGVVKGDKIYWLARKFPGRRAGSWVTVEASVSQVIGNKATGKGIWNYTEGDRSCNGTTTWTDTRLPRKDTGLASSETTATHRNRITAEELFGYTYKGDGPVQNDYFMPYKDAGSALHEFSGTLVIKATEMTYRHIWSRGNFGPFPELKINFFTHQGYLVPIERNKLIIGDKDTWDIILAPGRVWSEPSDNGYSRASFPFTLVGSIWSETHNGIATFIYNDKRVSALRFQIVQEAAPGAKFDAWGQAKMTYTASILPNQSSLTKRFADELARQTPIRSWGELEKSYDPQELDIIDATTNRDNITLSGLIIDDVVYARPCRTRYGNDPYCDQMRHGVYSISKSLGAMVAMLRLAQKYGDEVFDLRIKDYVDIPSKHDGWNNVTFGDTLNMATGIGDVEPQRVSHYVETDSTAPSGRILWAKTTNEKLKLIAAMGNYPWEPGEVFRYRTSDTFVLTVAMDRFIKSKEGQNAGLWDLITREVLQPIGIARMPVLHTIEPGGVRGVPLFGIGMLPNLDEVVKLVKLLRYGGRHQGEQILSATKLDEVFGKDMRPGLPTGWQIDDGETYYHMSLWLHPFRAQSGKLLRIPAMSGHGGTYVIIMPNGITAFRFADGRYNDPGTWDSSGLRKVADYIRPF